MAIIFAINVCFSNSIYFFTMSCLCASKPKYRPTEADKKLLFTPTSIAQVTDERMQELCEQAKAVFKEQCDLIRGGAKVPTNNILPQYWKIAAVYIKQNRQTPLVLVVSGEGDRTLDYALFQTFKFLFEAIGNHAQLIPDSDNELKINKRLGEQFWDYWPPK